jgi:hypothetical protein
VKYRSWNARTSSEPSSSQQKKNRAAFDSWLEPANAVLSQGAADETFSDLPPTLSVFHLPRDIQEIRPDPLAELVRA